MRTADLHCDTISELWKSQKTDTPKRLYENDLHVDIQKMKKSGYLLQNFALFTDLGKTQQPFEHVMELVRVFKDEMERNKNDICVAKTYDEILENAKNNRISALMTVEEGGCCEGQLKNLETLYHAGARMMTLTWNYPNGLGCPGAYGLPLPEGSGGLTPKGFLFIERMQELGMIVDVSHLSDRGFWDVVQHTKKPFAASHSNARALCPHARNLTDDMIKAIADRGGMIGLNFYGRFLNKTDDGRSTVAGMAEHARHIINTGGSDCLGLGSDFDGISGTLEMQDCSQMYKLADELGRRHISHAQIEKIFYRNVLQFYKEML